MQFWNRLSVEGRASIARSLQICCFFGLVSVAISIVYKVLLSQYGFTARCLLLAAQQAVCLLICLLLKRCGVAGIPAADATSLRPFLLAGGLFVANIMVGWLGLTLVNIPLFLCIRRTTVAFALVAEMMVLRKAQSLHTIGSVSVIVLGAVVAGSFSSDLLGIAFTLGNNALTAWQLAASKAASDATGVRGFGIVYLNAIVALPLCLLGATVLGEWEYAAAHPALRQASFWVAATVASSCGILMTYATILCSTQVSPLATTVTGNVKDVLATVVGALAFGDFVPSVPTVTGIVLSFVGAGWFSAAKLLEQGKLHTAQHESPESSELSPGGEGGGEGASGFAPPRVGTRRGKAGQQAGGETGALLEEGRGDDGGEGGLTGGGGGMVPSASTSSLTSGSPTLGGAGKGAERGPLGGPIIPLALGLAFAAVAPIGVGGGDTAVGVRAPKALLLA